MTELVNAKTRNMRMKVKPAIAAAHIQILMDRYRGAKGQARAAPRGTTGTPRGTAAKRRVGRRDG